MKEFLQKIAYEDKKGFNTRILTIVLGIYFMGTTLSYSQDQEYEQNVSFEKHRDNQYPKGNNIVPFTDLHLNNGVYFFTLQIESQIYYLKFLIIQ